MTLALACEYTGCARGPVLRGGHCSVAGQGWEVARPESRRDPERRRLSGALRLGGAMWLGVLHEDGGAS